MLSNKLTFSLASLVFLLVMGLCLPASAQITVLELPQHAAVTGPPAIDAGDIPDESAVVYGNATDAATAGVEAAARYVQLADLENLKALLDRGVTIELVAPVPNDNNIDAMRDLVISEVMWGEDDAGIGTPSTNRQWIEIYNRSGETVSTDGTGGGEDALYLVITEFDRETYNYLTALSVTDNTVMYQEKMGDSTTYMVVDRISNVNLDPFNFPVGTFAFPGQSGNTATPADGNNFAPQVPIISAQRNFADLAKGHEAAGWTATEALARRNTTVALLQANPSVAEGRGLQGTDNIPIARDVIALPSADMIVINEVRNHIDDDLDWVELKNIRDPDGTDPDVLLTDWSLVYVAASGNNSHGNPNEVVLVENFPAYRLAAQDILLIVNRTPNATELAGGVDLDILVDTDDEQLQKGADHLYIVRPDLVLPSDNFLLVLRNHKGRDNHRTEAHLNLQDVAGNLQREGYNYDYRWRTKVYPFRGAGTIGDGDRVKQFAASNEYAWERKPHGVDDNYYEVARGDNNGRHKDSWRMVHGQMHTYGLGYDRGVDLKFAAGTPGYENIIANTVNDYVDTDPDPDLHEIQSEISISEVMYDAGPHWNLIQWIELYNSSMTQSVDIAGWELEIRNAKEDVESYVDSVFTFVDDGNTVIHPNQTLLIVSGGGATDVAPNRVYNLYEHHRRQLGLTTRRSVLLSPTGFYLKLTDRKNLERDSRDDEDVTVDEAGNVMVDGAERIIQWALPVVPTDDGIRRSLVRQYGARYTPQGGQDPANVRYQPSGGEDANIGNPTIAMVDTSPNGWMDFWRPSGIVGAGISFYGHRDDVSTPGYRAGGPLPVELSSFRPVRNKETGEVVIRWATESELNNAGFNILRSETKKGEFKVVNLKGIIAGHGTTSEKHVYEWKDTTAKPNVTYYYQIEDVSFNGKRTTLGTTHLRGHITAAGKVTTTWGDLKDQK